MLPFSTAWRCETELPLEAGIPDIIGKVIGSRFISPIGGRTTVEPMT